MTNAEINRVVPKTKCVRTQKVLTSALARMALKMTKMASVLVGISCELK